jgi:hypothetical protein
LFNRFLQWTKENGVNAMTGVKIGKKFSALIGKVKFWKMLFVREN